MFLGTCWMKLGSFNEAAAEFHALRTVDPTQSAAYEAEALALEAAGRLEEASKVRSRRPALAKKQF